MFLNPWSQIRQLRKELHASKCSVLRLQDRERQLVEQNARLKSVVKDMEARYISPEQFSAALQSFRK